MKDTQETRPDLERDDDDLDDIEIIEVVGLNDDEPPPSDRETDEVEVDFAESDDEAPGATSAAAVAGVEPARSPVAVEEDEPMRERLLRLQADFENFKKRVDRERDDYYRHATSTLVGRLLPVIDNLERALATEPKSEGEEAIRQGVGLIHRQLMDELRREGLVAMESVGQPFDPNHHEAVATDGESGMPPNTVVEEIQRGYFFRERVLRPAAVKVSLDGSDSAAGFADGEES